MTFNDIFKSSFLEKVGGVYPMDMLLALFLSFVLGLFILFVYKKTYKGVMYSSGFGISLIALAMITSLVILAVTSNIVLSLGMVGALSIVRFRAAIKEPTDIAFLFWSISVGIVTAAGLIPLAFFGSLFIGIVILIFSSRNFSDTLYILVVRCNDSSIEEELKKFVDENVSKSVLKSKTVSRDMTEFNYEVRLKGGESSFVNRLFDIDGVNHAVLVSFNGDYLS